MLHLKKVKLSKEESVSSRIVFNFKSLPAQGFYEILTARLHSFCNRLRESDFEIKLISAPESDTALLSTSPVKLKLYRRNEATIAAFC